MKTGYHIREQTIHTSIIAYLKAVRPDAMVMHVPNEGVRSKGAAGVAIALGLVPGWPDIGLILPGGMSYWFEVKGPYGALSKKQERLHAEMARVNIPVAVVRSIDDVQQALRLWRVETRVAA